MGAGIVGILFIIAFFWALAVFLLPFFVWGISEKMDKQQKTLEDILAFLNAIEITNGPPVQT